MPRLSVSIDGVVIKEVQLTKERTTLGRRPYNDIVIDNLAVSGEHALLEMSGQEVYLQDLNSTNGTYVNGKAIKRQQLNQGDTLEVGKYKIKFTSDQVGDGFEKTMIYRPGSTPGVPARQAGAESAPAAEPAAGTGDALRASIKVMSGAAAGREVALTKVVTTIGKPGVAVAAITRRQRGYVVHHLEGGGNPALNGAPIGNEPVALKSGDVIELAGTKMQFVQA